MKGALLGTYIFLSLFSYAQIASENTDTLATPAYTIVEELPEFPGGNDSLLRYLGSVKYPPEALSNDLEGSVIIRYVVMTNGEIDSVEVARSSGHAVIDSAAVEHIRNMPPYSKPGIQNNKPVRVQFIVPLKFYFVYGDPKREKKKKNKG